MPTFPYNSQNKINANPVAPIRNEAGQAFQDEQKVIGTLQEITQKWSDANDVMQYTEAKAKHGLAVADIESRAAADPNFRNSDKYFKELNDAKENSVAGISNQQVASKASLELGYDTDIAALKIKGNFQKKQLDYNKVMVKTELDTAMKNKLSFEAGSAAYMQADSNIQTLLQRQVQSGVLSYDEADKMLKDSQETAVKYEVYNDNSTQEKDSTLLKELKKSNGKYSFLDPDTRLKMIEESQRRIFQNNQTFKREIELSKDNRFNDVFSKMNEGTFTLADLDREMAISEDQGGIPKKQLLEIRKGLEKEINSDLKAIVENDSKAADYQDFVDNFISDETDRQKGREAIVNAFKDGILSPKEATFLNKLKRETEGVQSIRSREEFMGNALIPFKNAINAVNDFFTGKKNFTESDKAMAIKKILNYSADGENPQEISQKVIKESIVKNNPNILNLNPEGQLVADENGNIKMMNNNGDHWNIEEAFKKAKESK